MSFEFKVFIALCWVAICIAAFFVYRKLGRATDRLAREAREAAEEHRRDPRFPPDLAPGIAAAEAEQMRRTHEAYALALRVTNEARAAGLRGDPIPERFAMIDSVQQAYREGQERARFERLHFTPQD